MQREADQKAAASAQDAAKRKTRQERFAAPVQSESVEVNKADTDMRTADRAREEREKSAQHKAE